MVVAALRAYREKRYADFARLAGSHWTRTPASDPLNTAGRPSAERGEPIRTGKATALPSNRLLR